MENQLNLFYSSTSNENTIVFSLYVAEWCQTSVGTRQSFFTRGCLTTTIQVTQPSPCNYLITSVSTLASEQRSTSRNACENTSPGEIESNESTSDANNDATAIKVENPEGNVQLT